MDEKKRKKIGECYECVHRRTIPGDCHSMCVMPDAHMTGNEHGIRKGWFMYPINFDPTWKTKLCDNFESKSDAISVAVSGAVSESKSR